MISQQIQQWIGKHRSIAFRLGLLMGTLTRRVSFATVTLTDLLTGGLALGALRLARALSSAATFWRRAIFYVPTRISVRDVPCPLRAPKLGQPNAV